MQGCCLPPRTFVVLSFLSYPFATLAPAFPEDFFALYIPAPATFVSVIFCFSVPVSDDDLQGGHPHFQDGGEAARGAVADRDFHGKDRATGALNHGQGTRMSASGRSLLGR